MTNLQMTLLVLVFASDFVKIIFETKFIISHCLVKQIFFRSYVRWQVLNSFLNVTFIDFTTFWNPINLVVVNRHLVLFSHFLHLICQLMLFNLLINHRIRFFLNDLEANLHFSSIYCLLCFLRVLIY